MILLVLYLPRFWAGNPFGVFRQIEGAFSRLTAFFFILVCFLVEKRTSFSLCKKKNGIVFTFFIWRYFKRIKWRFKEGKHE